MFLRSKIKNNMPKCLLRIDSVESSPRLGGESLKLGLVAPPGGGVGELGDPRRVATLFTPWLAKAGVD